LEAAGEAGQMARVNPYLHFSGNCEEAFNFYRSVFGGEFLILQRFSEEPSDVPSPESDAARIMHVALPIGEGQVLMGSDRPSSMGPTTSGDNVHLRVSPYSTEGARRIFDMLSEGGQITMPFEKAVGGAGFGMCTDRFGVNWMVNYDPNEGTSASKRWWRG
jgi:PhnB protein